MEKSTEVEKDLSERIIDFLADFYKTRLNDLLGIKEKIDEIKHKDTPKEENKNSETSLSYRITWQNAAYRFGEDFIDQPPPGYFKLSPDEWLTLALKELEKKRVKEITRKDVEALRQSDGTKFHCLYLHKDHVLFIDWLLNHSSKHTNMPYSLQLANEIKEATSNICKKIEGHEYEERNGFFKYFDC